MEPLNNSYNYNSSNEDTMDFKRYISLFISNWYWFAVTLFFTLSVAYGINRYSQEIYTVSATLLIKDDQIGAVNSNVGSVIPGGDIFKSRQNLKNEMGILKSFTLNDSVIMKLKDFNIVYTRVGKRGIVETQMYKKSPFKVVIDSLNKEFPFETFSIQVLSDKVFKIEPDSSPVSSISRSFGERLKINGSSFSLIPRFSEGHIYDNNGSNKYYISFVNPHDIANEYRSKLSAAPIEKDASLVTLSVSGPVPEQEADYLNELMAVYIKYGLENKNRTADSTIKFIELQLGIILDSLKLAEGKIAEFRKENHFFDLSIEGSIIRSKLQNFENEKSTFDLQLQYYNYLSDYLDNKNIGGPIISPSIMGISDQVLVKLVNEYSDLQKEKRKLGFNIEENQPALKLIDKQIEESRGSLRENVRNGIAGLELSLSLWEKKISDVEAEISKLPIKEREYIKIQRKFELNNTVYTYLLEKRAEAGIAKASNIPDNRVIDFASGYSAGLIKPKLKINYMIALMLGLIFPIALIAMIDYFNDKVIDKRDVEKKTKVPVIGYISHSDEKNEIAVVEKPGSALAESFRAVRTSLKYFVKEKEVPVIAISSTVSSEGKTFISINLAAIIALLGKRVLLVGLDLRKPRINKVFEYEKTPGMSTFLSGNCGYNEVIKSTQINNLFYAPSGPIPPNPAELIETELMKEFFDVAKREFDYIIIDTPPVAIVTDALLLAPYANMNLYIVRQRYTSRNTIEMIDQLNNQGQLKNMAIVINDISLSGYYGYGMRYGYSMGFGYSYGYNYYGSGYYKRYGSTDKTKGYYKEE
jgi:tyrosine-protein kinase Etk/Wzc